MLPALWVSGLSIPVSALEKLLLKALCSRRAGLLKNVIIKISQSEQQGNQGKQLSWWEWVSHSDIWGHQIYVPVTEFQNSLSFWCLLLPLDLTRSPWHQALLWGDLWSYPCPHMVLAMIWSSKSMLHSPPALVHSVLVPLAVSVPKVMNSGSLIQFCFLDSS